MYNPYNKSNNLALQFGSIAGMDKNKNKEDDDNNDGIGGAVGGAITGSKIGSFIPMPGGNLSGGVS